MAKDEEKTIQNDLSFEQLYQQLYEEHRPQFKEMRKSIVRKLWVAGVWCVPFLFLLFLGVFLLVRALEGGGDGAHGLYTVIVGAAAMTIIISPLILYAAKGSLRRPYVLYFRENVARSFVALADSSLTYLPQPTDDWEYWVYTQTPDDYFSSILHEYNIAGFDGWVDKDKSKAQLMIPANTADGSPGLSNFITGEIKGRPFRLCCMSLQGGNHNNTIGFKGLFVYMEVSKSLNGYIKVARRLGGFANLSRSQLFIPKAERKKMDSAAFEKDFIVGSDEQITAMKYLTADIMELLITYKNELIDIQTRFNRNLIPQNPNDISLDFLWQDTKVLIRIANKKMFVPTMRDPMCKDSLASCLSSLSFATRLNHIISKSIEETAI